MRQTKSMEFFCHKITFFPVKSSFASSRCFKQLMKVKKIPQMHQLTFHVASLRYSDQVVRRIIMQFSELYSQPS